MRGWLAGLLLGGVALVSAQVVGPRVGVPPGVIGGGGGSILADAIALWKFDNPDNLGLDSNGSNHLAEVNTPTATGGALGYATFFENASLQEAISDPGFDFIDEDWAVCSWAFLISTGATRGIAGEDDGATRNWGVRVLGTGEPAAQMFDGAGTLSRAVALASVVGERFFSCGWHDSVGDTINVSVNDGTPVSEPTTGPQTADAVPTKIGALGSGNNFDGTLGPIYVWKGSYDLSDFTAAYNAGLGLTCAEASALGMTHCYDMDESGGPYLDSVGGVDFVAVNAPTRAAALVEQPDSGMSVHIDRVVAATLGTSDLPDLSFTGSFTFASWVFPATDGDTTQNQSILSKETGGGREYAHFILANSGNTRFEVWDSAGLVTATETTNTFGGWHFIVAWYDASDKIARVSVDDGTPAASAPLTVGDLVNGPAIFQIGRTQFVSIATSNNDSVAAFNKALTAAERTDLWNDGAGKFAMWLDTIFSDRIRFAWSDEPEKKRANWALN